MVVNGYVSQAQRIHIQIFFIEKRGACFFVFDELLYFFLRIFVADIGIYDLFRYGMPKRIVFDKFGAVFHALLCIANEQTREICARMCYIIIASALTEVDFKNLEFATRRSINNTEKFHYNPIPLTNEIRHLFPNVENTRGLLKSNDKRRTRLHNLQPRLLLSDGTGAYR